MCGYRFKLYDTRAEHITPCDHLYLHKDSSLQRLLPVSIQTHLLFIHFFLDLQKIHPSVQTSTSSQGVNEKKIPETFQHDETANVLHRRKHLNQQGFQFGPHGVMGK